MTPSTTAELTADKIAAEAAEKIIKDLINSDPDTLRVLGPDVASVIQSALSQSLAARDKEIAILTEFAWQRSQHRWWCKDSWMIGKCNCGSKEMYEFLDSLQSGITGRKET